MKNGRIPFADSLVPVSRAEVQTYTRLSPRFEFVLDLGILVMATIATRSNDLAANLLDNERHHVAYL